MIGRIFQVAYVVEDIHESIEYWTKTFSVGPFVLFDHVRFAEMTFHGEKSNPEFSMAFADRGDTQIELIQQHDAAPSVYRMGEYRGIHHVGIRTNDIVVDQERLTAAGMTCVQRGVSSSGSITVYMDGGPELGLIELIQSADNGALAQRVRKASETWDGTSLYAE